MLAINCVEHCWNLNPTSTIKSFYIQVFELAICTSAIRHLVCPLKFSITFVWFLLGISVFPGKEDNAYANFWGQTRCVMADVQMANLVMKKPGLN